MTKPVVSCEDPAPSGPHDHAPAVAGTPSTRLDHSSIPGQRLTQFPALTHSSTADIPDASSFAMRAECPLAADFIFSFHPPETRETRGVDCIARIPACRYAGRLGARALHCSISVTIVRPPCARRGHSSWAHRRSPIPRCGRLPA